MSTFVPKYIVVHTAAFGGKNCDRDLIDSWHRAKGWEGIGYHYVIINNFHSQFKDGTIQEGRSLDRAGAHTYGLNQQAIGICCTGNGDQMPFTQAQIASLIRLISDLIDQYDEITVDRVIGHREVNALVERGILAKSCTTTKTCPGRLVDMDVIRNGVRAFRISSVSEKMGAESNVTDVKRALEVLDRSLANFPNANQELVNFLSHPEVLDFRGMRLYQRHDTGPDERPDSGGDGRPGSGGGGRPD